MDGTQVQNEGLRINAAKRSFNDHGFNTRRVTCNGFIVDATLPTTSSQVMLQIAGDICESYNLTLEVNGDTLKVSDN